MSFNNLDHYPLLSFSSRGSTLVSAQLTLKTELQSISCWDRDIVGDVFSDRCHAWEAAEALGKAVLSRFSGRVLYGHELTLRVDRDPQFTARSFREAARILNARLEYTGIQCPEDKPYIESFFSGYKTEELYRNEYNSLAEAKTRWESYRV